MNKLSLRSTRFLIIFVILIIGVSYGLFFYLQTVTENNIKNSLFEQQKQRQTGSTMAISAHIGSDLNSIMVILQGLADNQYLQQGDLTSSRSKNIVESRYLEYHGIIDSIGVIDKYGIVAIHFFTDNRTSLVGKDLSFRQYFQESKAKLAPLFSNGFQGLDGRYRIAITYPIVNGDTGQYVGLVVAYLPTVEFFAHYGNVHDINSQFVVAYDKNATLIAVGASQSLVGKPFFGGVVQQFINHNALLDNLTSNLIAGKSGYAIYDYGRGERLTTSSPILVNGKPEYFLEVVTPTSTIYSMVSDTLVVQRIENFSVLAGTTAAIVVAIVLLANWNMRLKSEVRKRTEEIEKSNAQLTALNEQLVFVNDRLKANEKMQKEFINIAAHELRTPIQPILGLSEILRAKITDKENCELLEIIVKNTKRLQHLASELLDVTNIESQSLRLHKEQLDINEILLNVIEDYKDQTKNGKVRLVFEPDPRKGAVVSGDRERLYQVISNLLSNAVKFTEEGKITIKAKVQDGRLLVTVKDTGAGIDPEVFPKLFTKFATKSEKGTGLGLFISKSIIEAHGGNIWAESNKDGSGAVFSFSLPIYEDNANINNNKDRP